MYTLYNKTVPNDSTAYKDFSYANLLDTKRLVDEEVIRRGAVLADTLLTKNFDNQHCVQAAMLLKQLLGKEV